MPLRRPLLAVLLVLSTLASAPALSAPGAPAPATCGLDAAPACHGRMGGVLFLRLDDAAFVSRDGGASWAGPLPGPGGLAASLPRDAASLADAWPYAVLVLATPMLPEWQAALQARGLDVLAYYPHGGFLVALPEGPAAVADLPFVVGVAAVPPWLKLDPALPHEGPTAAHVLAVPGALPAAEAAVLAAGARVRRVDVELDRLVVEMDGSLAPRLATSPAVLFVDLHLDEVAEDMNVVRQMAGPQQLSTAPRDVRGQDIVGGVVDSGIDATHPDLQGAILAVQGPNSPNGHGTATFGIIFSRGSANSLATGMATAAEGVFTVRTDPRSRYVIAQDLRENWSGRFQSFSVSDGAFSDNAYGTHSRENDAIVFDHGVLVFRSMSNFGPQNARREAMAKNVVAVGGLHHADTASEADDQWDAGTRASTGPARDGRMKPDLSGPFDLVFTTSYAAPKYVGEVPHPYTANFDGTSAATPIAAGAGALAIQLYRDNAFGGNAMNTLPTPAMVKALLIASADPRLASQTDSALYPLGVNNTTRDRQGWGFPDVGALDAYANDTRAWNATGLVTAGMDTYTFTVPADRNVLAVTLVWTDPPATPVSDPTVPVLVNDLDLEVLDANGTRVFRGNVGLATQRFSSTGGSWDRLNNVENVFVSVPGAGTWTVKVRAVAVNVDGDPSTTAVDQPYALVVRAANEQPT